MVSSVNSLNSSYVARTKPLSFKAKKSLVPKSLPPLKTSICINSSISGKFQMMQFLIQKCAPTSATRSPYSPYPACVSSPPVKTLSI